MPSLVKILVRDFTPEEKKRVSEAAKGRKESLQKFTKRAILREAGMQDDHHEAAVENQAATAESEAEVPV